MEYSECRIVIGWTLFIIFVLLISSYLQVSMHENAHEQFCKYYDGNVTEKVINIFGESHVKCDITNANLKFLNSMNEITGYNAIWLMIELLLLVYGLGLLIIFVIT